MHKISPNFSWDEGKTTSTGLYNEPSDWVKSRMEWLAHKHLEVIRKRVGPMRVTSWYRSLAVNKAVGGSKTSQHMQGLAVDFHPIKISAPHAQKIIWNIWNEGWLSDLDQSILYHPSVGGHIHYGIHLTKTRAQMLWAGDDGRYRRWEYEEAYPSRA